MADAGSPRTVTVDFDLTGYLKKVNKEMSARFGVGYTDVHGDLHVNVAKAREAYDRGDSAHEFAEKTAKDAGLKPASPGFGSAQAREFNKRQAALVAFAETTPGWTVGEDGIYAGTPAGVVRFQPMFDGKRGSWEFGLAVADGASMPSDVEERPTSSNFAFNSVTSKMDIDDAWALFSMLKPEFIVDVSDIMEQSVPSM